jgi:protein-serine/threonine kinase
MDGNSNNRLFLNFVNNNEGLAPADRTYPTTPSTFPQPVFQSSCQQLSCGLQSRQPQYSSVHGVGNGYLMHNQYQSQYQNQPMAGYVGQNPAYQQRSVTPGTNDPNTGLAQQFSQLGGGTRSSPFGLPSTQQPRTAGTPGQSSGYGYMGTPMSASPAPPCEFQQAPERNPDMYGPNANYSQKRCAQLATDFFKDSVKRARERNQR